MSHLTMTRKLRHPNHSNVNLKPATMIDHLKIKVKQRCSSHRRTVGANDSDSDDEGHEIHQNRPSKTKSNSKVRRKRKTCPAHLESHETQTKVCLNGIEMERTSDTTDDSPVSRNGSRSFRTTTTNEDFDLTLSSRPHSRSVSSVVEPVAEVLTKVTSSLPACHFTLSSSSLEKDPNDFPMTCPCETHLSRMYVDQLLQLNVDKIYQNTFEDNEFTRAYNDAQKLIDFTYGEWKVNSETNKRERTVTYKTITHSILGTNTISCLEKQIIDVEKPGLYVVNREVFNEGMKYTDAFYVATRVCIIQHDAEHSLLRISAEVRYVKNVNGIARAFIDKNANASIESGVMNYIRRIENLQSKENPSSMKRRSNEKKKETKRQSTKKVEQSISINETINVNHSFLLNIGIFIGVFLLLVHLYLCYKLHAIDRVLYPTQSSCLEKCQQSCVVNSKTNL